jgi:hypothetical protein
MQIEHDQTSPPVDAKDEDVVFNLEVSMGVEHLTAVRRFVAELTDSVVHNSELASRLALTTHELLENAVKYSVDAKHMVTLRLWVQGARRVHVTVRNVSSEALVEPLREQLRQLDEAHDPSAYYQYMIAKSLARETGSGLGLARILAEGGMKLSCQFQGNILSINAQAPLGDEP